MLPKKQRLPKNMQLSVRQSISSELFLLKIGRNALSYSRFGFIVSKNVDSRAVVRNRVKRKYRACIESHFSSLKGGYDMLLIAKKESKDENKLNGVCEQIRASLSKGGLLA